MAHQLILSKVKLALISASIGLLASQYAAADSISLQGFYGGEANGTITLTNGINYHTNAVNVSFSQGAAIGSFNTFNATTGQSFESWCVDVFHDFNFGNPGVSSDTLKSATTVFGSTKASQMGSLYTEYSGIQGAGSSNLYNPAFQVALWAIVTNTSNSIPTVASGSVLFTDNTTVNTEANRLLNNLSTTRSLYNANIWTVDNNTVPSAGQATSWGAQDVVVFSAAPVPEPKSYGMMLAGLGLMGFIARRKNTD